ncbi:pilus assembly protein [Vibrio sp. ZSDZ34]|uniref:Pilus assembly protein n=1 Tax=Vibrio gelatinilyticus TaxID=2893468 RepID=A0A9X2AYV0_9VIBR|nr:TadE family protein [Vibrio gelatinilyticus]MCJ2377112.1 pilus assembly protein [Vibrio gelatinilyticus]
MKTASKQKGLAAVELVLITPIIIFLFVINIEVGKFLVENQMLSKMVRNGARFAITNVYGTASGGAIAPLSEIQNMVVYGKPVVADDAAPLLPGLVPNDISLDTSEEFEGFVVVTASHTYTPVFVKIPFTDISFNVSYSASSIMEKRNAL